VLSVKKLIALSVLVGREVEMSELMPKARQRQCNVLETDKKGHC